MTTAVKERPILFSGPMIRAILDGRKTQTRRVITPQPPSIDAVAKLSGSTFGFIPPRGRMGWSIAGPVWAVRQLAGRDEWECPYGRAGDRLWVRESLRGVIDTKFVGQEQMPIAAYEADGAHIWKGDCRAPWKWKRARLPSIYMPRWASRIRLELTEVRAQPLQNIIPADVQAESCPYKYSGTAPEDAPDWNGWFSKLWDGINPKLGSTWADDPWAWALTFERIQ